MEPRRETKSFPIAGLKAVDTESGTFEAIVSVFGNVDYHGHRIDAAAFDASLERWRASGDPIPIIFSHQWDDLSAYLGTADPDQVRALPPGDGALPEGIREFGGLLVVGQIDTTEPEGRKALKLLKSRAVREFSFAYDVLDEAKGSDGFLDLLELDLIEAGPTLKGANPLTQLIGAKAARDKTTVGETLAAVAEVLGTKSEDLAEALGIEVAAVKPDRGAKAFVSLPDTVERLQEAILRAGAEWAAELYAGNLYAVQLEGTYPADQLAILYVELWDDPPWKGRYFQASFEAADGVVTIGDPEPVELTATITPGAKTMTWSAAGLKGGRRNVDATDVDPDEAASVEGVEDEEPRPFKESTPPGVMRAILDLELVDL